MLFHYIFLIGLICEERNLHFSSTSKELLNENSKKKFVRWLPQFWNHRHAKSILIDAFQYNQIFGESFFFCKNFLLAVVYITFCWVFCLHNIHHNHNIFHLFLYIALNQPTNYYSRSHLTESNYSKYPIQVRCKLEWNLSSLFRNPT